MAALLLPYDMRLLDALRATAEPAAPANSRTARCGGFESEPHVRKVLHLARPADGAAQRPASNGNRDPPAFAERASALGSGMAEIVDLAASVACPHASAHGASAPAPARAAAAVIRVREAVASAAFVDSWRGALPALASPRTEDTPFSGVKRRPLAGAPPGASVRWTEAPQLAHAADGTDDSIELDDELLALTA